MPVKPAVSLSMLLRLTRLRPAIVYYAGSGGGHFSPLVGFRRGLALLPYNEGDDLPEDEFGERWSGSGYPRQSVLVGA